MKYWQFPTFLKCEYWAGQKRADWNVDGVRYDCYYNVNNKSDQKREIKLHIIVLGVNEKVCAKRSAKITSF